MDNFKKSSGHRAVRFFGKHRFEHWYRDNSVYFITSATRGHAHLFDSDAAKEVFWDRFDYYTNQSGFAVWIVTLMSNHYHCVGYMKEASRLGEMMRKLHGSVAKLVNDLLPERHRPFWRERAGRDYFDRCVRDLKQLGRAYNYTIRQSVRHSIKRDWEEYPHTRVYVPLEECERIAVERDVFRGLERRPRRAQ